MTPDAANRPTAHRDRAGTLLTAWGYDPLGRMTTTTDATGRTETRS